MDYLTIPSKFFSPCSHRPVLGHAENGTGRKLFRPKSAVVIILHFLYTNTHFPPSVLSPVPSASCLSALSVDNSWASFVILIFAYPHFFEGGKRSKDGSSNPDRVFSLWWSNDLNGVSTWGQVGHFFV